MSLITRDTSRRESSCGPGGQRQNYEEKKKNIKVGTSFAGFLFCFLVSSSFPASSTWSEGWSYSSSDVRTRNERSCKTFRLENLFLVVELVPSFSIVSDLPESSTYHSCGGPLGIGEEEDFMLGCWLSIKWLSNCWWPRRDCARDWSLNRTLEKLRLRNKL